MSTLINSPKSMFTTIIRFPLTRLVILSAVLFYVYVSGHIFRGQYSLGPILNVVVVLWMIGIALALYVGFVKAVELRPVSELSLPGMGKELGLGLLLGAGLYTLCIIIMMIFGVYHIEGLNDWSLLLGNLWMGLSSGFFEEMLFRGILFRITQEVFGSWVAIIVSSLAFGCYAHYQ
ncbi:MAG: CPBP family intramembrane glutamic endopeptidase [Flavobacteriaceae bacterium]|nr:CPBP family intramembrane glutamic endopeptidase [Flavobacteriaceae bacterium]